MRRPKNFVMIYGHAITLLLLIVFCMVKGACAADVTIDGSIQYQTIEAWGITHYIEWNWEGPNRYPIPEKDVMSQIRNNLNIDFIYVYHDNLYEMTNDDQDPFHYNWDSYNTQFDNHSIVFERLREMQSAGIKFAMMGGFHKPVWMVDANGDFDSSIPNVYDEFAEYWTAFMTYAKNNYDLAIPYIIIQHEPSYAPYCNFNPAEYRDAIKVVAARLRNEGFDTEILAPEDANAEATRNMCQTILPDPIAKSYISKITFHGYDGTSQVNGPDAAISAMTGLANDNLIKNSGLSLWMTEWVLFYDKKMRDYVDTLRLALDFAKMVYNTQIYGNSSHFVIWSTTYDWGYDKDGNGVIEKEGIFGPGVTDGKLNLKKYGHALTQYTKYIPPGSKRIEAGYSGESNVFVTAYKDLNTGRFSIVFINKGTSAVSVIVNVKNIPDLAYLKAIRTSAAENSIELGTIALNGNSFTATLLDSSVTTFTGHFKDSIPPNPPTGLRVVR